MAQQTETEPERLTRMRREAEALILLVVADWEQGVYDWPTASANLSDMLHGGHADAHGMGRRHGGDRAARPEEDAAAGDAAWNGTPGHVGEAEYWMGVDDDVQAGKYGEPGSEDNPPKTDGLNQRVGWYTNKWVATANDALLVTAGALQTYDWVLDDGAAHCEPGKGDSGVLYCPELARGGPYTAETLPAVPGDGSTKCRVNCRCKIVDSTGREGFSVVD